MGLKRSKRFGRFDGGLTWPMIRHTSTAEETAQAGAELAGRLRAGDVVLLAGDLGAGKTTLVRGLLAALGHLGGVRSPTFSLIQTYPTDPPAMHADLYRVKSYEGIGLEDYLDTHLCLVEWPDRAEGLIAPAECWQVRIDFEDEGRRITVLPPEGAQSPKA